MGTDPTATVSFISVHTFRHSCEFISKLFCIPPNMSASKSAAATTIISAASVQCSGCSAVIQSTLECPTCRELWTKADQHLQRHFFCDAACFKSSWKKHKLIHQLGEHVVSQVTLTQGAYVEATALLESQRPDEAAPKAAESARQFREAGNARGEAHALLLHAQCILLQNSPLRVVDQSPALSNHALRPTVSAAALEPAIALLDLAIAYFERAADAPAAGLTRHQIVDMLQGDMLTIRPALSVAPQLLEHLDAITGLASALAVRADAHKSANSTTAALKDFGDSAYFFRGLGDINRATISLLSGGTLALVESQRRPAAAAAAATSGAMCAEARRMFATARQWLEPLRIYDDLVGAVSWQAKTEVCAREFADAVRFYAQAAELCRAHGKAVNPSRAQFIQTGLSECARVEAAEFLAQPQFSFSAALSAPFSDEHTDALRMKLGDLSSPKYKCVFLLELAAICEGQGMNARSSACVALAKPILEQQAGGTSGISVPDRQQLQSQIDALTTRLDGAAPQQQPRNVVGGAGRVETAAAAKPQFRRVESDELDSDDEAA
jgi:hypothetical protein